VSLLVVSPNRKTPMPQMRRHLGITPSVFAQAMHQKHGSQSPPLGRGPVVHGQRPGLTL